MLGSQQDAMTAIFFRDPD